MKRPANVEFEFVLFNKLNRHRTTAHFDFLFLCYLSLILACFTNNCFLTVIMSIKIYLHVEEKGYLEKTSKIQVPKSWSNKSVSDVVNLFLKPYNEKSELKLDIEEVHLAKSDGSKIYSNDVVSAVLEDHMDYYIKVGRHMREEAVAEAETGVPMLKCRNYGCNKSYLEEENHEDSCSHHTAPPIFHDTMKCWSCCKDRKAYDFESFQLIAGCSVGRHSNIPQKVAIAASPNATSSSGGDSSQAQAAAPLKSIAAFNNANPQAASAVASAIKSTVRKSTRNADGTAKCQRKGCQKVFNVSDNNSTACVYHKGQPIFHDAIKIWSCCPDRRCFDFDEFLAVPGCAVGIHDDGEVELEE